MTAPEAAKAMAEHILRHASAFRWELQGFGMLRCYLPGDVRLQVWDGIFAVPGVTTIHDHPWHFDSLIVAGELYNERFTECKPWSQDPQPTHMKRSIVPGIGLRRAGTGEDEPVRLVSKGVEHYRAGQTYHQQADEVHESRPVRGTVTIIRRQRVGADVARSYYPHGTEWVSAEPRLATVRERDDIIEHALRKWFAPADVSGVLVAPGETFPAQTPMEDTSSGKTVGER